MKKAILFSLMVSGLLFGKDPQQLSGRERIALRTASPPVHTGMRHKHKTARMDRVVADKTTINAFVPVGK